jgi:hypothetical protein
MDHFTATALYREPWNKGKFGARAGKSALSCFCFHPQPAFA